MVAQERARWLNHGLELQAVLLALKHFLPFVRGQHVLVRTDNTTVVAYINRQGGLRSSHLHMLAHRLIIAFTRILGVLNLGADLLSRGNPRYKDWKLHSEVVAQIWGRYGQAKVDLFASEENAQCPLFYSLTGQSAPLGLDALAHEWPCVLLYAFPPLELITPTLARVWERGLTLILIAPRWQKTLTDRKHWLAEIFQLLHGQPWRDFSSSSGAHGSMGLARERGNLAITGLPHSVIATIQSTRASSTHCAYDGKWRAFEDWCVKTGVIAFQSPVPVILTGAAGQRVGFLHCQSVLSRYIGMSRRLWGQDGRSASSRLSVYERSQAPSTSVKELGCPVGFILGARCTVAPTFWAFASGRA